MSLEQLSTPNELSEVIAESFGANATYVETLLARFRSDPSLVDESWRAYFEELIGETAASEAQPKGPPSTPPQADGSGAARSGDGRGTATAARATAKPAPAPETKPSAAKVQAEPIRGAALKIVENMEASLAVPTATSQRRIPVKLLDENRRIINQHLSQNLDREKGRKASYTHLIAWAILHALDKFPQLNDGFEAIDGQPARVKRESVNLGLAIDLEKKDGTRALLVPHIKNANKLSFSDFLAAYDDTVKRAREGKLQIADFQGTTISLTNPGTIGTVASNPRLMAGQSAIIATGSIDYPAEYQAMTSAALSQIGISKTVTLTSTYDHRVIQGAESGLFLAKIDEFIKAQHEFYDEIFSDLEIRYRPLRWAQDYNPSLFGGDR